MGKRKFFGRITTAKSRVPLVVQFEYSRKDFWPLFVHHWVSTFLLIASKLVGYQQMGATLMLCNDNLDLIMPLAKLSDYNGYPTLYKIFAMTWCVLWIPFRIVLFFYKILFPMMTSGYFVLFRPFIGCWICFFGLCIIYFLQFIWTKYLLELVWNKVF